jgi:TonB family protein
VVEVMPEYPGGHEALFAYISENIKYPEKAKKEKIQGRVFVSFVVEKSGKVTNVSILRGIGGGCDEESLRVVSEMPIWKPGLQDGKPVRVQFNLPIKFALD